MDRAPRLFLVLLSAALLIGCVPVSVATGPSTPNATLAPGVYTYQPGPRIWQLVTIVDGGVANGAGAVFEWNCAGQSWTIGTFSARVLGDSLRFGDESFAIVDGRLDQWQPGQDPRGLAKPVCPDPTPSTKTVLSADAARELVKRTVTQVGPVVVPTNLPDRVSATLDARPDRFVVEYVAPSGARVTLRTAVMNPQPVQPGGAQRELFFRGDLHAFYQALDGAATTSRTLLWNEYSTKMGSGTMALPYALISVGLTETEFWQVANSLQ